MTDKERLEKIIELGDLRQEILEGSSVLIEKIIDHGKARVSYRYFKDGKAVDVMTNMFRDMSGADFRRWKRGRCK